MTGRDVLIAVLFLIIGWVLHMLWCDLVDWFADMAGASRAVLWDLLAVVGLVVVCVGIGFGVTHHWPGT